MMRLSALIDALPPELGPSALSTRNTDASTDVDPIVRGIQYDSRAVAPGDLFVALRGEVADGHDYLEQAVGLGATALLVEVAPEGAPFAGVPVVVVTDSRRALAPIATRFYGDPAAHCTLVGVTGTNGKTSTTYLVESILARANRRTGLIGTVEIRYAGERHRAVNTTPESLDLQRLLRSMLTHNIEDVVMEVSSHGLELGRVAGCRFKVAAFTNLTQDHLDFHGSMDDYLASKVRLFSEHLDPGGCAVLNVDDPASEKLMSAARERGARVLRCSRDSASDAEIRLLDAEVTLARTRARVALPGSVIEANVPLVGDFNLENLLVAVGIACALEIDPARIVEGVAMCPQVPGRMELVGRGQRDAPTVIVDYAHTPDAVDKLLAAVRPLARGRLIAVFGCGGDRDRRKRAPMAEAVTRHADLAIATSDNPRTEDADAILADVEQGLTRLQRVEPAALDRSAGAYSVVRDRKIAIETAIAIARPDDTVVIAGKGHEDYQIIGREKLPFDDRVEAQRALDRRLHP